MLIWGVINHKGEFIVVSTSERGAKTIATRGGYTRVGARSEYGYNVVNVLEKHKGRWVPQQ
jgi:hypothetical protein